jgi:hypothetical protein
MPDATLTPGFPRALALTLEFEGGLGDDPKDPGGRTAYGITHDTFNAYCDAHRQPRRDVFTITQAEVADIYHEEYWNAGSCDKIPWPLSLVHFDSRVNPGAAHARRFLMASHLDSGDAVLEANRYLDIRATYYRQIVAQHPVKAKWLNGWMNRIDRLRKEIAV